MFVTNWISTTKIQKISEITNFFRHYFLSRTEVMMLLRLKLSQKALASIYCVSEKAIKQKLFLYKDKVGIKNEHFSLRNYIENF